MTDQLDRDNFAETFHDISVRATIWVSFHEITNCVFCQPTEKAEICLELKTKPLI